MLKDLKAHKLSGVTVLCFAEQAFTKDKQQLRVHYIWENNTTMVAQIHKMGGDLLSVTKQLWEYCLSLQIVLTPEYLTSILNTIIVDQQSRSFMGEKQVVSAQTSIQGNKQHWSLDWSDMEGYSFSPFCLISRCLAKVQQDKPTS